MRCTTNNALSPHSTNNINGMKANVANSIKVVIQARFDVIVDYFGLKYWMCKYFVVKRVWSKC